MLIEGTRQKLALTLECSNARMLDEVQHHGIIVQATTGSVPATHNTLFDFDEIEATVGASLAAGL